MCLWATSLINAHWLTCSLLVHILPVKSFSVCQVWQALISPSNFRDPSWGHFSLPSDQCLAHFSITLTFYVTSDALDIHTVSLIAQSVPGYNTNAKSVLYDAPPYTDSTVLQWIQNTLARIVLHSNWFTHSNILLHQLHWLPVQTD
jgi:hypothetical protein